MAAPTKLMTVDEYRHVPEPKDGTYYELHHGELVRVTRPKQKHHRIQERLIQLLSPHARDGVVSWEVAFRAEPEYEIRAADVAYVSRERYDTIDPEDNLRGAPELVIEVVSPSNTASELHDKELLCLANGCREFWVVDPQRRIVKVSTPDGNTKRYDEGDHIPLSVFGSGSIPVAEIFNT